MGMLIAMAAMTTCGISYADSIQGSPGAGFQRWLATDLNNSLNHNLNDNGAPYWDYATTYDGGDIFPPGFPPFITDPPGQQANVGYCLTGTGNCPEQLLNPGPSPGPIPFWGFSYDPVSDTGGLLDPKFFFKKDTPNKLRATLELQLSRFANELNEFGWFETNKDGSFIGPLHPLFMGSMSPTGPTPLGTTVSFSPTRFYGYYFIDVSEPFCRPILSVPNPPNICTTPLSNPSVFSQHSLAAFATDPGSPLTSFWIAALNAPRECQGADCNLTLVKVQPIPMKHRFCDDHGDKHDDRDKNNDCDKHNDHDKHDDHDD
jgi:hypothetical protein